MEVQPHWSVAIPQNIISHAPLTPDPIIVSLPEIIAMDGWIERFTIHQKLEVIMTFQAHESYCHIAKAIGQSESRPAPPVQRQRRRGLMPQSSMMYLLRHPVFGGFPLYKTPRIGVLF